ncbi:alkaline phosphatase [Dictyobacter alpinus]|uniref:Alkaline phosphatase n=1 Tax=Dictyobacter alpinus TaxID=2014873 RepID=A0A402B1P2_9CHLR|nr:alkaline phosphatase D family protein [Dictyobacter alpinus]GCE25276.1 alkaline phosphatase [Dictyobacter alpinus]
MIPDLCIGPLVRAVSPTSIVIWAELTAAESVTLRAQSDTPGEAPQTVSQATVLVGGHHYVALHMQGLRPGTWYRYQLTGADPNSELKMATAEQPLQYFRTLPDTDIAEGNTPALRIAYGSCRKSETGQQDVFSAFGNWLREQATSREASWPHLLLLIGDQIYADQPSEKIRQTYSQLGSKASGFEDFRLFYQHAWATDPGARQALACIPTYMIFDDHEITNNWNSLPTWRAEALAAGQEQLLVDGTLAYWIYQGWGNLDQATSQHPLLKIMQKAALSGEDAVEALRARIRQDLYGEALLPWHYEIHSQPAIFVANARTERSVLMPTDKKKVVYEPMRIISQSQTTDLQNWSRNNHGTLSIIVSSVPVLLPPLIGQIEYLTGLRLWFKQHGILGWLGDRLARFQQKVAARASFDHWPLYSLSWQDFILLFQQQQHDMLILSGDVHFSYALTAESTRKTSQKRYLYQFVSTPLQNALNASDQQKITAQARISRLNYGGLKHEILPMTPTARDIHIEHNLLFENTIAMLTLHPDQQGQYTPQQEYLGYMDGSLQKIATTVLPTTASSENGSKTKD